MLSCPRQTAAKGIKERYEPAQEIDPDQQENRGDTKGNGGRVSMNLPRQDSGKIGGAMGV